MPEMTEASRVAGNDQPMERFLGIAAILVLSLMSLNGLAGRVAELTGWGGGILESVEVLLLLFFLVGSFWLGYRRHFFFSLTATDAFLLLYLLIGGLSWLWSDQLLVEYLIGLRYSAALFIFYLAARIFNRQDYWFKGARIALTIVAAIAATQLLAWWLIPVSLDWPVSAVRDFAGGWPRLYGSFAGPNQLATFLVLGGLGAYILAPKTRWPSVILIILVLATFSRSALLGLLGGLISVVILLPGYRRVASYHLQTLAIVGLAALAFWGVFASQSLTAAFNRSLSDSEHIRSPSQAVGQIFRSSPKQILLGHGAGSAGPATINRPNGLISENWYLQVMYEYGLAGALAMVGFLISLLWRSYQQPRPELLMMTVAVMINALFLHPLSDNAAATVLFLLGAGCLLGGGKDRQIAHA